MTTSHFLGVVTILLIFLGAGCVGVGSSQNSSTGLSEYSDLSPCGDFPYFLEDGQTLPRYYVCRSVTSGVCYHRSVSSELINGCNPASEEHVTNPEACMTPKTMLYHSDGSISVAKNTDHLADTCALTTAEYFDSTVK
jgi:hypothetical protein